VTWTNATGPTHTSTSNTGVWNTGNIAPGATSGAVSFPTVGTFPYHCAIHPSMTGSVIVSAAAPGSPPVRGLAPGGGGPQLPIGAALLLLGFGLLAARRVRRHRPHGAGEGIDKLPHQ
jgi:MYXO-CTERM domain-containing protein